MKKFKNKLIIYLLCSYIILVPLINNFMKLLEKSFQINLNTIDITLLNLFTIIFRNKIILLIWIMLNIIIILAIKNIIITKENSKIEVEGINLKKKDRHIWNSWLGNKKWNRRISQYWKKRWNNIRTNWTKRSNNLTNRYISK